jgi:hypothetical protein
MRIFGANSQDVVGEKIVANLAGDPEVAIMSSTKVVVLTTSFQYVATVATVLY